MIPERSSAETSLAERIRGGDRSAEEELARLYHQKVFVMVLARAQDRELARELAQEVMLIALRGLREGKLRHQERLAAFVRGIARNLVNNHLRARSTELRPRPDRSESLAASPDEGFEQAERLRLVRGALERLKPEDRMILLLTLNDGLKPREIAERLGLEPGLVRKRKSRAIERARKILAKESRK